MIKDRVNVGDEKSSVLFVDDEDNILLSLKRLFRDEDYYMFFANSGLQGLEIMENNTIDLVVSDMFMPDMNGADFLEKVAGKWPTTSRVLLTGYSDISSTINAINKGHIYNYVSKPWEDYDFKLVIRNALERKKIESERDRLLKLSNEQNVKLKEFNDTLEEKVESRTTELNQTMAMLESAYDTLKQSYTSTIQVFSSLIEMREGSLRGQSKRVADTAKHLALEAGLSQNHTQQIFYAGLLRDIGKIGLSEKIINKPYESLSPDNQHEYARHPIIASSILMSIEPLQEASQIIRSYRERFDGKGYPDKLIGKDIPVGSRILAIASDYNALQVGLLTDTRISASDAKNYIAENSSILYDPDFVEIFLNITNISNTEDDLINNESIIVQTSELQLNMILAKDLITADGIILLSEGHKLGEHMIRQIQNLENSLNEQLIIHIKQ